MSGDFFVAALVVAVAVLVAKPVARVSGVPYPVFLVLAGVVVSVLPGVPVLELSPDIVFFGFLPPLVYWAAFVASPEEFAADWEPIGLLAVGLVLATTVAVAATAHAVVPGLTWGPAFVLGAVVAPTDPVAAGEVIRKVGASQRITTVLEGESLINDGVALVLYGLAVSSTSGMTLSVLSGFAKFLEEVAVSLAVGLVVGAVARLLRRHIRDADAQIVLSLVVPYVAYIVADHLGASGVLATVAAGLYVGWRTSGVVPATTRLRANTFWDVLVYLLNAVLFLLLGAQFEPIVQGLGRHGAWELASYAGTAVATAVVLRISWLALVPPAAAHVHVLGRRDVGLAPLRHRLLMGWSGMRGAVSLAAALSIPYMAGHRPFPDRSLLVFVTFSVILATLVLQGGSLPWVVRGLHVGRADRHARAEASARQQLAQAALVYLDRIVGEAPAAGQDPGRSLDESALDPIREIYREREKRAARQVGEVQGAAGTGLGDSRGRELLFNRAWRETIQAQRRELVRLRRKGEVDHATMGRLLRELDLDEARRQD